MNTKICPTCGQPMPNHNDDAHRRAAIRALLQGYTQTQGQTLAMGSVIARSLPAGASWERREPTRTAEIAGDVAVPLAQSGVTAIVGGLVGLLVAGPVAGAVSTGLAFGVSWLVLLVDHRKALWSVEKITGVDLDGDGHAGDPNAHEPQRVRVEIVENNGRQARIQYLDLPLDLDKLTDVAHALLEEGASLSRRSLSDVITQTEYNNLGPALVNAGLARDLPGNRRELTGAGRSMLRELINGRDN